MNNRQRIASLLLLILLAVSPASPVWAQQPDQERRDLPDLQELAEPPPASPAVQAILDTNPSTAAELARAAKILADLGRPELGKGYLKRIIDGRPDQQQLVELVERFGAAMFTDMAARKEMSPEAKQLADALLAAANRALRAPKRLERLIRQLRDPSPDERSAALVGLKEARSAGIGALLDVLADPSRAAEHAYVRIALAEIGFPAVRPLLGMLEGADPRLTAEAIRVLAIMDAKQATIHLLRPGLSETADVKVRAVAAAAIRRLAGRVPTRSEAVRLLSGRAKAYFNRERMPRAGIDGRVEIWRWDAAARRPVAKAYSPEDAARVIAARLARDAYVLAKDVPEVRLLYLATMLEATAYENCLDKPLPDGEGTPMAEAAAFGVAVIEDLLEDATAGGHAAAATAAARILGRTGTAERLLRQGPRPAPLVRATRHPDRRVRLAASDAVIRLQPAELFPGASYIPESLAFFAASRGNRRALLAGPSTESLRRPAGKLAELGFEIDTASTGRELIRLATASPDYELAMIDAAIEQPPADLLLQRLRSDCRTADLRIGWIARSGYLPRARQLAEGDSLGMAFSRPHTDEATEWQLEQLATLAPQTFVAHGERLRQAAEALDRLAELSGSRNKLYDVRRWQGSVLVALYTPPLSAKAAAVLGNLNSAESQQALVALASRWTQPLPVRRAAVQAFRRNTQQYGIRLTTAEIHRQYDRYNASAEMDPNTQRVLGLILDCIEAPTQAVKVAEEAQQGQDEEAVDGRR